MTTHKEAPMSKDTVIVLIALMLIGGVCTADYFSIKQCPHKEVENKNNLIWCKECGEVLCDVTPKHMFNFRNTFWLDGMTYKYGDKEYMNLKYVIKKINEELKEETNAK